MRALIFNPPYPVDSEFMLTRTYAGGYGTLQKKSNYSNLYPPVELLTVASFLRDNKIEVSFVDYQVKKFFHDEFQKELEIKNYDIIISIISLPSLEEDCRIINICRQFSKARIFIYSNIIYEEILGKALSLSGADAVIYPSALLTLLDIVNGYRGGNMAYLSDKNEVVTGEISQIEDADLMPIPARDLVDYRDYKFIYTKNESKHATSMSTSYGCPYNCRYYCPYPAAQGRIVRMHSVDRVIQEMKEIKKLGIDKIIFRDPVFTFDKDRILKICKEMIKLAFNFTWWCETRIDKLDFELLNMLKEAGCEGIEVGIESGDEYVLKKQAKTGLTIDRIFEFNQMVKELKIEPLYLFLLGLPLDTPETVLHTIRLILELDITEDQYSAAIITPYPGTLLYEEAKSKSWLIHDWNVFTGFDVVSRTDNLSINDMLKISKYIENLRCLVADKKKLSNDEWTRRKNIFLKHIEAWLDINDKIEMAI